MSSYFVEDGSYLKLRNIRIGYVLPQSLSKKKIYMQKLRFYLSAQNLLTVKEQKTLLASTPRIPISAIP